MTAAPHPIRALLSDATSTLRSAGVESAALDARLLLAFVLGVPTSALVQLDSIDPLAAQRFAALLTRRGAREPLQHLTGTAPFRFLSIEVGPGVFIPRPETELLVDAVLPRLGALAEPLVVDLCAGSGALALAIAHEVPAAQVVAVERSPAALTWLRENCRDTAVTVVAADIADPTPLRAYEGRVDVVVSNPPYVPSGTAVGAEVRHDPAEAVFAGVDGLSLIPTVIERAATLLRGGGVLAVEHDETHALSVPALLREHGGWEAIADHLDLTGRARYASAVRR